jgi:hypothetical protein
VRVPRPPQPLDSPAPAATPPLSLQPSSPSLIPVSTPLPPATSPHALSVVVGAILSALLGAEGAAPVSPLLAATRRPLPPALRSWIAPCWQQCLRRPHRNLQSALRVPLLPWPLPRRLLQRAARSRGNRRQGWCFHHLGPRALPIIGWRRSPSSNLCWWCLTEVMIPLLLPTFMEPISLPERSFTGMEVGKVQAWGASYWSVFLGRGLYSWWPTCVGQRWRSVAPTGV